MTRPAFTRRLVLHYSDAANLKTLREESVDLDHTLRIVGDPDNGSYEWVLQRDSDARVIRHSDCGYGQVAIALLDGLLDYFGAPDRPPPAPIVLVQS